MAHLSRSIYTFQKKATVLKNYIGKGGSLCLHSSYTIAAGYYINHRFSSR